MKKLMFLSGAMAFLCSLSFFLTSCQEEELLPPENLILNGGTTSTVEIYNPKVATFGRTYAEWSKAYWKYMLSIPFDVNPINDKTGENALTGQNGRVVFLAGTTGEPVVRNIALTSDKAILIPAFAVLNTFPCPENPSQPRPGQTLEEFLKEGARAIVDRAALSLMVKVDGKAISRLGDYRVMTDLFPISGSPDLNTSYGTCIGPEDRKAVSDGFFILLKGLKKGNHTIEFSREIAGSKIPALVTYKVRVTS